MAALDRPAHRLRQGPKPRVRFDRALHRGFDRKGHRHGKPLRLKRDIAVEQRINFVRPFQLMPRRPDTHVVIAKPFLAGLLDFITRSCAPGDWRWNGLSAKEERRTFMRLCVTAPEKVASISPFNET